MTPAGANFHYHQLNVISSLHPESQSKKFGQNCDEIYDEAHDENQLNGVKPASKCLVCMKGCWDPEFEPGIEESRDYQ